MALPFCGVRCALRSPHLAFLATVCAVVGAARATEATRPVDPAERNTPFAPAATVTPDKQAPAANTNARLQERRFETTIVDRPTSPLSGQRAAIDIRETREKNVREADSHRPERKEQPVSAYNHRESRISTSTGTSTPPMVAKYQESLTAASASNMARFPAMDGATSAKINRFVFRKNPTESQGVQAGAVITPAAGGSPIQK